MHEATCAHCGIGIGARHDSEEELFCCYGCEIAYAVIGRRGSAGGESQLALYKFGAGCILGINVMMFSMPLYVESLGDFFAQGVGAYDFFEMLKWLLMAMSIPVLFLLGTPFIDSSFRNLRRNGALNADILISIGVLAAFAVSLYNTVITSGPVYYETAVGILVVVSGGRYLEARTRAKALKQFDRLNTETTMPAHVLQASGEIVNVDVKDLAPGMSILVRPGEIIPVDALVTSGEANIGETMLTGESKPILRKAGDEIRSGAMNYDGVLIMRVLRREGESYIATVRHLIENARLSPTTIEAAADKFSRLAVPIIIIIAIGSFGYWWYAESLRTAFLTSLSVLLIACPCAIGIATPAALWVALTESSKRGILLRSLAALERLAHVRHIFFDKTGTLTKGTPQVIHEAIHSDLAMSMPRHELLTLVQAVSALSNHPLSRSLAASLPKNGFTAGDISQFREVPSQGIEATINGIIVRLGKQRYIGYGDAEESDAMAVWCSLERGKERNIIEFQFEDELVADVKQTIERLQRDRHDVTILSGDKESTVARLRSEFNVKATAELTAHDKLMIVHNTPYSAFVGDGINDAAAIAAADVGISLSHGTDLARQDADIVIFDHALERIPQILDYSKRTFSIIKQNLFWSFAYNGVGVVLAAIGILNPIIAAVAMTVSSFIVIQNSLRLRGEIATEVFREH